jgi:hypothetical protein
MVATSHSVPGGNCVAHAIAIDGAAVRRLTEQIPKPRDALCEAAEARGRTEAH